MTQGVLLVAHGARDPRWAEPFEAVAARIRAAAPGVPVVLCFLDLMQPDIAGGGARLAAAGCAAVAVVPLFLGAGGHVRRDLPEAVARLAQDHASTRFTLQPAAGEQPEVIAALAGVALAGLAGIDTPNPLPP